MKRGQIISGAVGIVLLGGIARAQADPTEDQNSDNQFDGPGYYAEDYATSQKDGSHLLFKGGGPFDSYNGCMNYLQQYPKHHTDGWSDSYSCTYRTNDPTYSAGCFLTTACVQHAGLADDCEELTVMRAFRDGYLSKFDEGRLLIDYYYKVAPGIVEQIRRSPDRHRTLEWILREVRTTAKAVGRGDSETAIARYASVVSRLQKHYR